MKLTPYPRYVPSGVEWLGDVPEHWEVRRLRHIVTRNDGGIWGEDDDPEGTIVLRSTEQSVDGGWQIIDPAKRNLTQREKSTALLKTGDLVVTKSSGSSLHIGKTSLVSDEVAALQPCYSNFMQRLRVAPGFESRLVWYVLNSPTGRQQLVFNSNTTTGLANLNEGILGNVFIAVPSTKEQLAIAEFLDREIGRVDRLVEKKRQLIERLKEKRTAVISRAVTRGLPTTASHALGVSESGPLKPFGFDWLGDIPTHWDAPPLYSRYSIELGKMLNEGRIMGHALVPYLRNVDVQWDRINLDDLPEMDIEEREKERFTLEAGDLLVCEGGDVGRAAIFRDCAALIGYQKALHRMRPLNPREDSRFMFYTLAWASSQAIFLAEGNPNTIPHLTGEKLRRYRFPRPPFPEQVAIAAYLDGETANLDGLMRKVEEAIERLQEYRTALITAAVTGKIDVRRAAAR